MTPREQEVAGGRLVTYDADAPTAFLLLGHGAGGGIDSFDLVALAEALPARGISVGLFEQPWRTAGRKVAGPPTSLDGPWQEALALVPDVPLVVGGRSAGARVACRCFEPPARGVVALSFPLHPPGKPEKSRLPELDGVAAPVLLLQGESDPMGRADEVRSAVAGRADREVVAVPGAAHSLKPTRKSDDPAVRAGLIVDAVAAFVTRVTA